MAIFKDIFTLLKKYYIPIGLFFTTLFLLVSFVAPYILTSPSFSHRLDFSATGNIGSTNPEKNNLEEFYVRRNASAIALTMYEMYNYSKDNWG